MTQSLIFYYVSEPYYLSRNQIRHQFVHWRRHGGPPGAEACALGDAQIISTVNDRVGSVPQLLRRALDAVTFDPVLCRNPSLMPGILQSLVSNQDFNAFLEDRVRELKRFVIDNFARRASHVSSHSLACEIAILDSRIERQEVWVGQARPTYVTSAFLPASTLDANALRADNVECLIALTHNAIDRELCAQFRQSFGPSRMAGAMTIPPFLDNEPSSDPVQQTLSYIAGAALSALRKAVTACENSDPAQSKLLKTFVGTHSITKEDAVASGVPVDLIAARSKDLLIFPSREVYELIVLIEHSYSNLLIIENVLAFGGEVISEVYRLTRESNEIKEAFDACMGPVCRIARAAGCADVEGAPVLEKVLKLYMRIRGKDAVKTLVSDLKQSAIANSLRGKLAATAAANDKKRKCRPDDFDAVDVDAAEVTEDFSSEFGGEYPGNFDAADVGLAEVIEEFSRAPDSTPDADADCTHAAISEDDL